MIQSRPGKEGEGGEHGSACWLKQRRDERPPKRELTILSSKRATYHIRSGPRREDRRAMRRLLIYSSLSAPNCQKRLHRYTALTMLLAVSSHPFGGLVHFRCTAHRCALHELERSGVHDQHGTIPLELTVCVNTCCEKTFSRLLPPRGGQGGGDRGERGRSGERRGGVGGGRGRQL